MGFVNEFYFSKKFRGSPLGVVHGPGPQDLSYRTKDPQENRLNQDSLRYQLNIKKTLNENNSSDQTLIVIKNLSLHKLTVAKKKKKLVFTI